jgi:hypothetical protein
MLKATVQGNQVLVQFSPSIQPPKKMTVWVAPLSGREITQVKSGENRGRTLKHCFVALNLSQAPLKAAGNDLVAKIPFDTDLDAKAIAIWVSGVQSLEPIQATGGWLE